MAKKSGNNTKGDSGHVSKSGQGLTVTYRPKNKRQSVTLPLTLKWMEEHPENVHWSQKYRKKKEAEK